MPAVERSTLHVEGRDDVHVVKHLLLRHQIDCPLKGDSRPAGEFVSNVPEIRGENDKNAVLEIIELAVSLGNGRSVGFVLDADAEPRDRWRAVCDRLRVFELALPDRIPPEGFVADVAEFGARVGVWLMPDNRRGGALEQFLEDLVHEDDALLPIAERSTEAAVASGAEFPEASRRKAVLHTWLAWQRKPGLPYGSAVGARYFRDDSPAALAFVEWCRHVFRLGDHRCG